MNDDRYRRPASLTAGPNDDRDAFWCWAHTTAVLFDDHGPSAVGYLRSMEHDYREQCEQHDNAALEARSTETHRQSYDAARKAGAIADAYADAVRVIELATDAASRLTQRYDDEQRARAIAELRHPWGPC